MSRRANVLLLLALTAGAFYGGLVVPWIATPDPQDAELQQLREENELLSDRLDSNQNEIVALKTESAKWRLMYELTSIPASTNRTPPPKASPHSQSRSRPYFLRFLEVEHDLAVRPDRHVSCLFLHLAVRILPAP